MRIFLAFDGIIHTTEKKSSLASYAVAVQENQEFFSCTDISVEKFSSLISVQENARLDFFCCCVYNSFTSARKVHSC